MCSLNMAIGLYIYDAKLTLEKSGNPQHLIFYQYQKFVIGIIK